MNTIASLIATVTLLACTAQAQISAETCRTSSFFLKEDRYKLLGQEELSPHDIFNRVNLWLGINEQGQTEGILIYGHYRKPLLLSEGLLLKKHLEQLLSERDDLQIFRFNFGPRSKIVFGSYAFEIEGQNYFLKLTNSTLVNKFSWSNEKQVIVEGKICRPANW